MSAPDPSFMASHFAGPVQAGAYVNSLFTGIALMQLQVYIRKYKGDSILIRGLVALSCSIMTLNTVLTAFQAYYSTIVRFGDIVATYTLTLPFQIGLDTIVLPSSLIQLFFAWRVKRLTGRTWVLAIVATSVIFQWSVTITAISIGNVHTSIQQVLALTGWALSMAIDTLITVNLVIFFNTRKTGYSDTDDFLAMLNRVAIQTGVMISLWNVTIIILESIYPDFTSLILIVAFPPLYVITLLSSLNSRHATDHGNHWSDDTPWTASGTVTAPRRVCDS
ncbi:hypothetical protein DL93DRAFT_125935 [Clavulina sp. PMI_390]|nr:hypothetical protein DL93DRAFT_125935 [Clavulina sp. PMI_390]